MLLLLVTLLLVRKAGVVSILLRPVGFFLKVAVKLVIWLLDLGELYSLFLGPDEVEWADLASTPKEPPANAEHRRLLAQLGGKQLPLGAGCTATRLRPRARWVRALEATLGGRRGLVAEFVRGRWTPDLPSPLSASILAYARGSIPNGVKVLGGGLQELSGEQKRDPEVYLVIDDGYSVEVVFPELLAKLRQYALYRQRDEQLLGSLRSRAGEWCRAVGLPNHVADLAIASATSYAMIPSTHEELAISRVVRACGISPLSFPSF